MRMDGDFEMRMPGKVQTRGKVETRKGGKVGANSQRLHSTRLMVVLDSLLPAISFMQEIAENFNYCR